MAKKNARQRARRTTGGDAGASSRPSDAAARGSGSRAAREAGSADGDAGRRAGRRSKAKAGPRSTGTPPGRWPAEPFIDDFPLWSLWTAAAIAGAVIAVAAAAFDPDLFAPFFVARFAPLYPLVALFAAVWVWVARPGRVALRVDLSDALTAAAAVWLAIGALVSPAPYVAWLGYYNRGSGVVFWIAILVLYVLARRLLAGERQTTLLVVVASATLVLSAGTAILQSRGVETWWRVGGGWPGRMTGTTGNPINLAGLCLLTAWLGVWAVRRVPTAAWLRAVAACGVAAGVVGTALSVTRAAYLGLAAAAVLVAVVWIVQRRVRLVGALAAVVLVLAVTALVQTSGGGDGPTLVERFDATNVGTALGRSDSKRVQLWRESLDAVGDRPLAGYGGGAFVVADRLHRPAKRMVSSPWNVATDPHSAPLLIVATTGIVGGLLAAALGVLCLRGLLDRPGKRRPAEPDGRVAADAGTVGPGDGSLLVLGERRLAALAYLTACLVYLLVSPVDLVVVAPLALIAGAAVGPPEPGRRLVWRLPPAAGPTAGRVVWGALLAVVGFGFIAAVSAGALFWSADRAMGRFAAADSPESIRTAHERFPWEPLYSLEAGARFWREGLSTGGRDLIELGDGFTRRGVELDPTGPMGYADLMRLAIAENRLADVPAFARDGLGHNPDHPILQGLWAYAAFHAIVEADDPGLSAELLASIEEYGPTTPDAWHWIGMTYLARGDKAASKAALARARDLAPRISDKRYEKRLLRGR